MKNDLDDFITSEEEEEMIPASEVQNNEQEIPENNDNNDYSQEEPIDNDELVKKILESKGFSDLNKMEFLDEDNNIIVKSFDELNEEQKLQLISGTEDDEEVEELSQNEENVISFLRKNQISFEQLQDYFKQKGVEEYLNSISDSYIVDDYEDDELYIADIHNRFPDLKEEELLEELNRAKSNEDLYVKKIAQLREYYKNLEDEQKQIESEQQIKQKQEELVESITGIRDYALNNIKTVGSFDIEPSDVDEVIDYMYKPLVDGYSRLQKDFSDTDKAFKSAFYALHGDKLIKTLTNHYEGVIDKLEKEIASMKRNSPTSTVVKKPSKNTSSAKDDSIWDQF